MSLGPTGRSQFRCLVIAAHRGDGITTACDLAERIAQFELGAISVRRVYGQKQRGMMIAELLSPREVAVIAAKTGMISRAPLRRPASFRDLDPYVATAAEHAILDQFVSALAAALIGKRTSECLIIDDYAQADDISKAVLRTALAMMPTERRCLWIIFESVVSWGTSSTERLSTLLLGELGHHIVAERAGNPRSPAAPALADGASLLFELMPLSQDERNQLAEDSVLAGRIASPSFLAVKDITGHTPEF